MSLAWSSGNSREYMELIALRRRLPPASRARGAAQARQIENLRREIDGCGDDELRVYLADALNEILSSLRRDGTIS